MSYKDPEFVPRSSAMCEQRFAIWNFQRTGMGVSRYRFVLLLGAIFLAVPSARCEESARPNILLLVADDLGYSDLGCFGSEINTPHLDALAAQGVTLTNFYTASTCSPTRAMLLTGVDHHQAGLGNMYEFIPSAPQQIGKPGYEGHLNRRVVTMAEVLRSAGYYTGIAGKWHVGRRREHSPAARGFDRSWVLLDGWAEHFFPGREARLPRFFREDGELVDYPLGKYSSEWYTDKAIEFVDEARIKGRPFFVLVAYTAPHWPLQAPPELIEKQQAKYDMGYDQLRQRRIAALKQREIVARDIAVAPPPQSLPVLHHARPSSSYRPWDELTASERRYSARLMEVYAAMVESMDAEIGRLIEHLQQKNECANTLICFLSDNGAAPMYSRVSTGGNRYENVGHPRSFVGYGPDWARASTGPFRMLKGHAAEGGIRAPCIIKLPNPDRPRRSPEFTTVLDIAPTIYELAGVEYPALSHGLPPLPLRGHSMLPHLRQEGTPVHPDDYGMGWELFGRAAYRKSDWKITWIERPFGTGEFQLFDVLRDPGETRDQQAVRPETFRELREAWRNYARQTGVVLSRPEGW